MEWQNVEGGGGGANESPEVRGDVVGFRQHQEAGTFAGTILHQEVDFLEGEVKLGEAEDDGVRERNGTVLNFVEEYEKDTNLAYCFSCVSFLGGEEVGFVVAYVL